METKMNVQTIWIWIKRLFVRFGISTLGLWWMFSHVKFSELKASLASTSLAWLTVGIILTGLANVGAGYLWAMLLRFNSNKMPFKTAASLFMQGLFWGHLVPGAVAGDVVRTVKTARLVGEGDSLAALVVSRLAEAVATVSVVVLALVLVQVPVGRTTYVAAFLLALGVTTACSLLFVAHAVGRVVDRTLTFVSKRMVLASAAVARPIVTAGTTIGLPRVRTLAILFCFVLESEHLAAWIESRLLLLRKRVGLSIGQLACAFSKYRKRPQVLAISIILSFTLWSCNLAAVVAFAHCVGVNVDWPVFAICIPLSALAQAPPVSVNGMGLREPVMIGFLVQAGAALAPALTLALIVDVQVVPFALVGGLCWLLEKKQDALPVMA
jgi:uncharacterized protein (TIRG00374 family)